jgi:hypothetical protein
VHVDAEGAPVDLRCPQKNQAEERLFQPGLVHVFAQMQQRIARAGRRFHVIDSGFHVVPSFTYMDSAEALTGSANLVKNRTSVGH